MYNRNEHSISVAGYLVALKTQYRGGRKSKFDKENFCFRWYRPISFYPAAILLRLGVSANAVTVSGCLFLLCACALLAQGNLLSGALLYLAAYILDFVDGNIARFAGKSGDFGKTIDGLVDSLTFLIFIAIAIGNSAAGEAMLKFSTEMTLGLITAFVFLLRIHFYLRLSCVLALATTRSQARVMDSAAINSEGRSRILKWGKAWYFGLISAMPLLLVFAVILKAVSLYLVGYCLMFTFASALEVAYGLRRVWLQDIQSDEI